MAINAKFSIERLPRAMRADRRESEPPKAGYRYFRVVDKSSNYEFFCSYKPKLVAHIRARTGDMHADHHYEVSDDLDAALQMNDLDRERSYDLLQQVAKHVAAGHYNSEIIEYMRKICEVHKLHGAESILASAPARSVTGPIEAWCMSALDLFAKLEIHRIDARRRILARR